MKLCSLFWTFYYKTFKKDLPRVILLFSYSYFCDLFSPILRFSDLNKEVLSEKASVLVETYDSDLSTCFVDEIFHLKNIFSTVFQFQSSSSVSPLKLLNLICEKQLEPVFMNVCIALRLFSTAPVSVASGERAFSKLGNRLKTWERASTGQERLNALAILSIGHQLASKLDFSHVINEFSMKKISEILNLSTIKRNV